MSLGFPTNPSVGDQYTVGETTYEWNGFAWIRISGSVNSATVGYFEVLYVTSTTNTTALGTGSLIVTGGASIGGNLYILETNFRKATQFSKDCR